MTDILDRIDAAVHEQCACGCGRSLDPNGPSGWFATDACQWEWQQQNATEPADVYNRPDADDIDGPEPLPLTREAWAAISRRLTAAAARLGDNRHHEEHVNSGDHVPAGREFAEVIGARLRQGLDVPVHDGQVYAGQVAVLFLGDRPVLSIDPAQIRANHREAMRQLHDALEPGLQRLNEWGAAWRAAAAQVVAAHTRPEPDDPRQRALAHVRNRNTGPRQRQRAPRDIQPGRGR